MVNEPFDLYIDAIRYIPDNATITKVRNEQCAVTIYVTREQNTIAIACFDFHLWWVKSTSITKNTNFFDKRVLIVRSYLHPSNDLPLMGIMYFGWGREMWT